MKKYIYLFCFILFTNLLHAQNVGIGTTTPNLSAQLDIKSNNKGLLIPRMTSIQRKAIVTPADGLMVYDSSSANYWYYQKNKWQQIGGNINMDSSLQVGQVNPLNSYTLNTNLNLTDTSGFLYDSGGLFGNYSNNENFQANFENTAFINFGLSIQVTYIGIETFYDSLYFVSNRNGFLDTIFLPNAATGIYNFNVETSISSVKVIFKSNNIFNTGGFAMRWDYTTLPAPTNSSTTPTTGWYFVPEKLAVHGGTNLNNSWGAQSTGVNAFSFGSNNNANGDYSNALGLNTSATAVGSTAIGAYTKAKSPNSLAIGKYNDTTTTNRLFEIGNGTTENARSNAMTVLDNGNVGIGAISPSQYSNFGNNKTFEIKNNASAGANLRSNLVLSSNGSSGSLGGITWASPNLTIEKRTGIIDNTFINSNQTKLLFYVRDFDFFLGGSLIETMSLTPRGLGIKNSDPHGELHLKNGFGEKKIILNETSNNEHQYFGFGVQPGTLKYQAASNTDDHVFFVGTSSTTSNELFRIKGNGDVGEGTSTPSAYGHGGINRIFELKNNAAAGADRQSQLILSSNSNGGSLGGITWASASLTGEQRTGFIGNVFETADQTRLGFYTRNNAGALGERFYVSGTGNAWLQGTLTQNSDARLKENIIPLTSTLKNIQQLNGYTYNWKDKARDSSLQIGVLAQELQKVYPQLVKQDEKGTLSVNYIGLVPVLIESVKEQQKQIEELKAAMELIKQKIK